MSGQEPTESGLLPGTQDRKVTCRICGDTYVPNFFKDFYPDGNDPEVGRCENCLMSEVFKPKIPTTVSDEVRESLCRPGRGAETCAFLVVDGDGFSCAKGSDMEATLREKRLHGTMRALGDNCSGPPSYTRPRY